LNGKNGETIWNYQEFEETWMLRDVLGITSINPGCPIDIDIDGTNELILGRSLPWDSGAELVVYRTGNNELVKTVTVEGADPMKRFDEMRWQPAVIVSKLSDLTGDGVSEIATVMALGDGNQKQLKLLIVDVVKEEIISDFSAMGTTIQSLGDEIAVYGTGGQIFLLKPEREISITSPQDGDVVTSPITVTWESGEETVNLVMVSGMMIMKSDEGLAEFDIREGERKITIYSFDRYGKGVYDSVDVIVSKEAASAIPLTIIVTLLIGVLFLPKILPMLKRSGFSLPKVPGKKASEPEKGVRK